MNLELANAKISEVYILQTKNEADTCKGEGLNCSSC